MLGALYATTLFFSIINATVIQPVVFAERAVSYRERAAGTYSVLPWVMALVSATATLSPPHKPPSRCMLQCMLQPLASVSSTEEACTLYWRGSGPLDIHTGLLHPGHQQQSLTLDDSLTRCLHHVGSMYCSNSMDIISNNDAAGLCGDHIHPHSGHHILRHCVLDVLVSERCRSFFSALPCLWNLPVV